MTAIAAVLGPAGLASTFALVWMTHLPLGLADVHVRTLIRHGKAAGTVST
ncbi:hypothetical protein [Streptomyces sp. NPDC087787]